MFVYRRRSQRRRRLAYGNSSDHRPGAGLSNDHSEQPLLSKNSSSKDSKWTSFPWQWTRSRSCCRWAAALGKPSSPGPSRCPGTNWSPTGTLHRPADLQGQSQNRISFLLSASTLSLSSPRPPERKTECALGPAPMTCE